MPPCVPVFSRNTNRPPPRKGGANFQERVEKTMKRRGRRLGALLLALVMVLSLVPVTALAARIDNSEIAIEAPDAVTPADTAELPIGAENAPAQLAEGETISPDTRYESWEQLTGSVGSRTKTVSQTKNSVEFQAADYNGNNFNASGGNNSVWTNSTINAALQSYTGDTRWVAFDMKLSTNSAFWSFGLWAKDTSHAFQCAIKSDNSWFTEYFGQQTGWPDWASGNPTGGFGTDTHHVKVSWTDPDGGTPTVTLTIDNTDYTVPIDSTKAAGLDKTTQNFAFRVGNGTRATISNVRYSGEPEGQTVSGTVTADSSGVANATVIIGGMTTTTDTNGQYSFEYVPKGTITATAQPPADSEFVADTKEVTISDSSTTVDFTLPVPNRTISGTVTTDGSAPLAGAKVELVQNNAAKSFVSGVTAGTTDDSGRYSLSVNYVAEGSYCIRVSKDGHGAKLSDAVTINADAEQSHTANVTLPAIDVGNAKFAYDMTENSRPTLGISEANNHPTADYVDDKLVLNFKNINRMDNIVKLTGTGVKNGTIEFDATRTGADTQGRFGLALRLRDSAQWIYVGSEQQSGRWFHEYWNDNPSSSGYLSSMPVSVSFGHGETRHFKVTINEGTVEMEIDGISIFDTDKQQIGNQSDATKLPMDAQDVGFICGNNGTGVPCTITIDNLYIFREDQAQSVTLNPLNEKTLTAKIVDSSNPDGKDLINGQAYAGDVIRVTCTGLDAGKALGGLTVVKTDETGTTVTATQVDDGVWQFTMPEYAVTVTGELKNSFTATLPSAAPQQGKAYTVTLDPIEATVSYQWYRVTAANSEVAVGENSATYTPVDADQGKTLKVVVTGTEDYAGIKTLTTSTVTAPDVEVTGVTIARETIKMIKNGDGTHNDNTSPTNTVVSGNSTTLTATVAPANATGLADETVAWTVTGDAVTLGTGTRTNNAFSMPITAVKNGTATVTATATSADGSTQRDTVTITVVTKVENVTIKNGAKIVASTDSTQTGEGLTIYANRSLDSYPSSATLTVEVLPADASTPAFNWSRVNPDDTGLITITGDAADGSRTITAASTEAVNVGTKELKLVVSNDAGTNLNKELTFTTTVLRHLANSISIGLGGKDTPTFGQNMEADVSQLVVGTSQELSDSAKSKLVYTWYTDSNTDGSSKTQVHTGTGTAGKTYTPVAADIGKYIFVEVKAEPAEDFFYEGTVSTKTDAVVAKADGPAAPTLSPTKPSTPNGNDGSITITNYASSATYQIKVDGGEWADATVTSEGKIEGKAPGKYFVKVKESDTHKESAEAEVTIADADAVEYTIGATNPTEGATITVPDKATKNTVVTIALTVTEGWQVDAVKVNDGAVQVTKADTGNTWTFTMPESNVTVTAEVSKIQVKIKHNLTNMSCNLPSADQDHVHTVNWGEVTSISLTADEGYTLPTSTAGITVKVLNDNGTEGENYTGTLTYSNGVLGFGTNGLRASISITAAATLNSYTVSYTGMTGLNRPTDTEKVYHGGTYTRTLTTDTGYALPETITVTMVGNDNPTYTYDNRSGGISITNVTGNVTITANGVRQYHQVTGVSIDTPANLQVDTILSATTAPANAVVSYQWMSCATQNGTYENITNATAATYTLTANDIGKWIKVKVTGDNEHDYDGTAESAAVGPVIAKVVLPTGISLDKPSHTGVVGETFTLAATIAPNNATDKTITWSVFEEGADTPVEGIATVTANNSSTATVNLIGAGTVRINARTVNGLTANCTLSVDRAPSDKVAATAAPVNVVYDGEYHSITVVVSQPTEGYTILYSETEDGEYTSTQPKYKEIGEYTIYFKVEAEGLTSATGSATVTITAAPVIPPEPGEVDTTALEAAIEAAEAAKEGITTSDKAANAVEKDVQFVTAAEMKALTDAIATAEAALKADDQDAVDTAVTALNGAVTTFRAAIKTGTMDDSALKTAIADAKAAKEPLFVIDDEAANVKKDLKFVTTGEMSAFNEAIKAAEAALNAEDKDQTTLNAAVTALNTAKSTFDAAIKTGESETAEAPVVNTDALDAAIKAAQDAMKSVTDYAEEKDPKDVTSGTKFVTTAQKTALTEAIATAQAAKDNENKTDGSVANAVDALNAAVETFNNAIQTGTKSTSSGSSGRPSSTGTVTKPDGTKVTTVTQPDGTKTVTTEKPDGSKEVVETKKDGTVTETKTDAEGAKTEKVTTKDGAVTITATDADGEQLAKVDLPAEITEPEAKFEDIDQAPWAEEAIHKVAGLKLVEGTGGNKYSPVAPMTRGALATVLHRLSNGKTDYQQVFKDVAATQYYAEGVAWAAKANVVKGISEDIFAPDQVITREQLAVMLCRYAKLIGMDTTPDAETLDKFADGDETGTWAVDGVAWCVANGILKGKGNDTLDPTAEVTRAEVAVMLDRFIALIQA